MSFARKGRGHLRDPELELGLGEELTSLGDKAVVGEPDQAGKLVSVTGAVEHAAVKPDRRPAAVIAAAGVGREAAAFVQAWRKEPHRIELVEVAVGVEPAA